MSFATTKLSLILSGLSVMLKHKARKHAAFRKRLAERNFGAQIMTRDEEMGRWFEFKDGKLRSGRGLHAKPDCKLMFKDAATGARLLTTPINWLQKAREPVGEVLRSVDADHEILLRIDLLQPVDRRRQK